ncbi:molybdopterin molybdotransferase MoeA [Lentzea aerocolonigenes]|uniref:molybdopterin molybdotransferase MoeA n=1 Tax=Lentzea aerocolonigenes TaxID=68170 RepID=UPI0004C37A73|nr:molybdopterin molybdotransferase MoeA [Lentzea aerocolonigenes]MCP2245515.1 molybdopterin molybdotransferase [Lentzea aerocolonigenes]
MPQNMPQNMPWPSARRTAREAAKPLEAVELVLSDAAGFALASGVRALASQPTCDTSAMDGYAVAGPGPWTVVGRIAAGDPMSDTVLRPGEAFGVATGAPVPVGSDLVIPVERCTVDGARLVEQAQCQHSGCRHVGGQTAGCQHPGCQHQGCEHSGCQHPVPAQVGKHIRRRGEDWSAGDELVPAGSAVSPAVLGLAAGAGHDTLLVHRRPRVTVIVTGDELLRSGSPRPGRVRDAIGPMLPGLLVGADLVGTTHVRDDPSALADALTNALTSDQADVLVTCGATSAGPADHLRRVLHDLGAEILVSGVACRPGHPMLLAVLPDGRCVVGLPGNPFAAFAAVLTLLQPLLGTLGGHAPRPPITARLTRVEAHPRDTRLVPVTRRGDNAIPAGHDRPGSLWGAALADALAVVPPGHQGGEVELISAQAGQVPV